MRTVIGALLFTIALMFVFWLGSQQTKGMEAYDSKFNACKATFEPQDWDKCQDSGNP